MNDHCPIPNFFANMETTLEFATHSLSLSFVPQEMSLNIDTNRILPVKVSGVSPNLLSRSVTLPHSCNVVNPGKYSTRIQSALHDSVIVSVAFLSYDPSYPISPSLVGLRMLMDPSKTQHRT